MSFTLIKFGAKWCGPCKKIEPFLNNEIAKEFPELEIQKVNIDEDEDRLSDEYEIESLPTFVLLKAGEEVGRTVGANEDNLRALLKDKGC